MGHVCARLQLLNTRVKFFFHCCQTPGIFRSFNKRVLAAQGQDKCVCPHEKFFFFFLNKRRKKKEKLELEQRADDHTLNMFATGRQTVGDPSVATCLMMICIFSQLHEKKEKKT